jgi:hypothetical protein
MSKDTATKVPVTIQINNEIPEQLKQKFKE